MYCFSALGLENCIEQTWRDSCMYLDGDTPLTIGRAYGRVSRHLLREELLRRWFFHSPCKQTKQSMTFSQYSHQSQNLLSVGTILWSEWRYLMIFLVTSLSEDVYCIFPDSQFFDNHDNNVNVIDPGGSWFLVH